jgi:Xaa-Pro aminopeptidase
VDDICTKTNLSKMASYNHKANISAIRRLMAEKQLAAYIIPATDPHISEYVPDFWRAMYWACGFTGSAGTLVITHDFAGVWTDGRYFIQAEQQLAGSSAELVKLKMQHAPEYIEWLAGRLPEGATVGVDGNLIARFIYTQIEAGLRLKSIKLDPHQDLIAPIWKDREPLPAIQIYDFPLKFAGASRRDKIAQIRQEMQQKGCDCTVFSSLDDIAWAFNLRGSDVNYNPVFVAHAMITKREAALFIAPEKISEDLKAKLNRDGVKVFNYSETTEQLSQLPVKSIIFIDPKRVNQNLPGAFPATAKIVEGINISTWLKAAKNPIEINHTRQTMIKDGVVLTKFFHWLAKNVGNQSISELSATEKLHELRSAQKDNVGESFGTIAGYRAHAAMPHYSATTESNLELHPEGLFLLDSGGQYLSGTTDTTRVISLGNMTKEERRDYTLVLKGMIACSTTRFPKGTKGWQLDALARAPMWQEGINYGHGTGHGVGYFMNVHEGPQAISFTGNAVAGMDAPLIPGMITSVEPGIYRAGKHGVRLENLVLCIEDTKNEFGEWLTFETLTIAPFFTNLVDKSMLSKIELTWLKNYNSWVSKKIGKFLSAEEKTWLKSVTK